MSNAAKKEYLIEIRKRYLSANKADKSRLLDELCTVCGYNRKYAIRLISKKDTPHKKKKGRPQKYYSQAIVDFLKNLWVLTNLACSERLKAAIPLWLPHYHLHCSNPLTDKETILLREISASTIKRILRKHRAKYKKFGLSITKPGSLLKKQVPIKLNQWDESKPGFVEADTVAHCGTSAGGQFVLTLNVVDIATGWTEQRAVWGKGKLGVFDAIKSIRKALPFKILGFDCDNGGEALNYMLLEYFTNKKNDNAHIEEKNWTHVRQFIGYERFDKIQTVEKLNNLYLSEWRLYLNFFLPSFKLIQKRRDGSKIFKKFVLPQTPYQKLINSPDINDAKKKMLTKLFNSLDPYVLQNTVKNKIINILNDY